MSVKINFVRCYADVYDLTNSEQRKKVQRMQNARQRFGRPSNGVQKTKTSWGYKNFDFITR
jgi:hypothetical protein